MRQSRRRAKSTVPIGNLTFLSKPLLSTKHQKNEFLALYGHTGTQNETVPEEGKIHRTYKEFEISLQRVIFQKTSQNENHDGDGDSGTQNETLLEERKSHRASTILINLIENDV